MRRPFDASLTLIESDMCCVWFYETQLITKETIVKIAAKNNKSQRDARESLPLSFFTYDGYTLFENNRESPCFRKENYGI